MKKLLVLTMTLLFCTSGSPKAERKWKESGKYADRQLPLSTIVVDESEAVSLAFFKRRLTYKCWLVVLVCAPLWPIQIALIKWTLE